MNFATSSLENFLLFFHVLSCMKEHERTLHLKFHQGRVGSVAIMNSRGERLISSEDTALAAIHFFQSACNRLQLKH